MVENGPRPPQKHQEEGSLFIPINSLLPSLHTGGAAVIVEELEELVDVIDEELVLVAVLAVLAVPLDDEGLLEVWVLDPLILDSLEHVPTCLAKIWSPRFLTALESQENANV
jgi:hypothetical protein